MHLLWARLQQVLVLLITVTCAKSLSHFTTEAVDQFLDKALKTQQLQVRFSLFSLDAA